MEDLKKVKKLEKVKYIQHHFLGRNNIDHAPITRKDSGSSENTSSGEDIVLTTTPFLQIICDMSNHYLLQSVQVEPQQHINAQIICTDIPYGMFCSYIKHVPIFP